MINRRLLLSSLATLAALPFAPGASAAQKVTIGYSVFWGTNPFLVTMVRGAKKAAEEWKAKGYEVDLVVTNGGDDDKTKQVNDLQDLYAQGVQGVLIFPGDSILVTEPIVSTYNKNNIPVVITDIGVRGGDITSFIITDNYAGGGLAAERLAKILKPGAKVVTFDYAPTNDNAQIRKHGFEETAKKLGLTVLPTLGLSKGMTLDSGRQAMEDTLVAEPEIAGVFSFNQVIMQGASAALASANRTDVKLTAFDLDPVSYKMVEDGKIDSLVVQDPYQIGYVGLNQMMNKLTGGKVEAKIGLGTKLLTKETFADFANDPQVTGK
jgi:ribose transport system substrate-binding protein